jgi:hypothetical protein
MESSEDNNNGYIPIELDIYDSLNWDFDLIIKCLEYIRNEIPNILKIESDKIDVFLVSFHNFIGETYPSIGIRNKTGSEKIILEYFDIEEEIEKWLSNFGGIEKLKLKSENIKCTDWETLKIEKEYPKF